MLRPVMKIIKLKQLTLTIILILQSMTIYYATFNVMRYAKGCNPANITSRTTSTLMHQHVPGGGEGDILHSLDERVGNLNFTLLNNSTCP